MNAANDKNNRNKNKRGLTSLMTNQHVPVLFWVCRKRGIFTSSIADLGTPLASRNSLKTNKDIDVAQIFPGNFNENRNRRRRGGNVHYVMVAESTRCTRTRDLVVHDLLCVSLCASIFSTPIAARPAAGTGPLRLADLLMNYLINVFFISFFLQLELPRNTKPPVIALSVK